MTSNEIGSEEIREQRFATAFRGFDTAEVKVFLARIAEQMTRAATREQTLRALIDTMQAAADSAAAEPSATAAVSEDADVAVRADADELLANARSQAAAIVAQAHEEAARVVLRARVEGRTESGVEAPLDQGHVREEAKAIMAEARAVRERILTDLAKRRRVANVQLEQLRAAREKLLESMRESRRIVDDAARDLSTAEVEARVAADLAARRMSLDPIPSAVQIEEELVAARYIAVPVLSAEPSQQPSRTTDTPASEALLAEATRTSDRLAAASASTHGAADGTEPAEGHGPNPARVDDLFARLRAEREAAAARAHEVLGAGGPSGPDPHTKADAPAEEAPALSAEGSTADAAEAPAIPFGTEQPSAGSDAGSGDRSGEAPDSAAPDSAAPDSGASHDAEMASRTERLTRALKRALQDEQSGVLAALRTTRGRPDLASVLPAEHVHRETYVRIAGVTLSEISTEPVAGEHARALAAEITRDLRAAIGAALLLGDSGDVEVAQAIGTSYREWRTERVAAAATRMLADAMRPDDSRTGDSRTGDSPIDESPIDESSSSDLPGGDSSNSGTDNSSNRSDVR